MRTAIYGWGLLIALSIRGPVQIEGATSPSQIHRGYDACM